MRKLLGFAFLVFFIAACTNRPPTAGGFTPAPASTPSPTSSPTAYLSRRPAALPADLGVLESFPEYDPADSNPFQIDLRGRDLSGLDLRYRQTELDRAVFDTATVWPAKDLWPAGFDPERMMQLGKTAGPGIDSLRAQGITGRGVGIGIVDSTLLVDHREYADPLAWYEEIDTPADMPAFMHGPAVSSIAVGKTVGVAPGANLYYIGLDVTGGGGGQAAVNGGLARGIRRLLEINAGLPQDRRIRVISVSVGIGPGFPAWDEFEAALQAADEQGVLVIYIGVEAVNRGAMFQGLGRDPYADPQDFASYQEGIFWSGPGGLIPETGWLFVPMDSRTLAAPTGSDQYAFYRIGGLSWAPPFLAGMYALAAQADPAVTPQRFWDLAERTGRPVRFGRSAGVLLDPKALIAGVQNPEAIPTAVSMPGYEGNPPAAGFPKIDRYPEAFPFPMRTIAETPPVYDPESDWITGLMLSNVDLSSLDLRNSLADLRMATFDLLTTWPPDGRMPPEFDPQQVMLDGKNPGPGILSLHAAGLTGSGVGIAIVGEPLLVGHREFAGRIQLYEDMPDSREMGAFISTTAAASLAAGETTGVAPEADLYFEATAWGGIDDTGKYREDLTNAAGAIRRLLEVDKQLPPERKIRVLMVMRGDSFARQGGDEYAEAVRAANDAGWLVVELTRKADRLLLGTANGVLLEGLGRDPLDDPEQWASYGVWGNLVRYGYPPDQYFGTDQLFIPSDSRTLADNCAENGYTFIRQGFDQQMGTSAYLAGAYALAAQADPGITPARFFELARQTGRTWQVTYKGTTYTLGPVLDLPALIAAL